MDTFSDALTKGRSGSRLFGRGVDRSGIAITGAAPTGTVGLEGEGIPRYTIPVVGLLNRKDWDEIGERANRIASYVCSRKGAWPDLPAELASWTRP